MTNGGVQDVNSSERSHELDADAAALLEAEVDAAIATCGGDSRAALRATLVANAYLEAEVERLTEAISTGFARGRIRK
jgi:hypothetical protein